MDERLHTFHAAAFVENLSLKDLSNAYPGAKRTPHELWFTKGPRGHVFIYPFGAVVFHNVAAPDREAELVRLRGARGGLTSTQVINEEFTVREDPAARPDILDGALTLDKVTFERASIISMTVAQSAAMDYYDRIVDQLFIETDKLSDRLEQHGSVPYRMKPLHRFIGAAIGTRNEVLSALHLLDKPDALWDDPGADRIYTELRAEFDLQDRHEALELKLRSVQEALELVLDVARDRRLVFLEAAIVGLIVFEIVLTFVRH